jgi:hypothetical protein
MLQSLPVDAKTKARSLLQSIEGKITDQPNCFHLFLALLKKLPGLTNLGTTLQKTYGITLVIVFDPMGLYNSYNYVAWGVSEY